MNDRTSRTHWTNEEAAHFIKKLRADLELAGVFRRDVAGYALRAGIVTLLSVATWVCLLADPGTFSRFLVVVLAGYTGVQAAAIAHEAGHGAVTRSRQLAQLVGHFHLTLLVGASYGAWVERHGAHHVHPNSRKDPDVRPWLFSFNEQDAQSTTGFSNFCTRHQHRLLYPLATLMGFSLKLSGWLRALRSPVHHSIDILLLTIHLIFWIAVPAWVIGFSDAMLNYAALTLVEGAYLALVFLTNHLGGLTSEQARHWPPALRQIVTARNLPSGRCMTHLFIGLNTHIEHHIFGHLPSTRLTAARAITRHHCITQGIPYRECTFIQAIREVHHYNRRMAEFARQAGSARQSHQRA